MAVLIEHEKRKQEILEKAFDLFVEEGYEDVTFQKIADRCGITRTTLYIYFKNKREIFRWSIKQLLSSIEKRIICIADDEKSSALESLERTLSIVLDVCERGANRIREMDRQGVKWKIFTDINMVAIDYKPFDASNWPVQKHGVKGPVRIVER